MKLHFKIISIVSNQKQIWPWTAEKMAFICKYTLFAVIHHLVLWQAKLNNTNFMPTMGIILLPTPTQICWQSVIRSLYLQPGTYFVKCYLNNQCSRMKWTIARGSLWVVTLHLSVIGRPGNFWFVHCRVFILEFSFGLLFQFIHYLSHHYLLTLSQILSWSRSGSKGWPDFYNNAVISSLSQICEILETVDHSFCKNRYFFCWYEYFFSDSTQVWLLRWDLLWWIQKNQAL